jgi:hypothetical protein
VGVKRLVISPGGEQQDDIHYQVGLVDIEQ